jgi:hypothetical protein
MGYRPGVQIADQPSCSRDVTVDERSLPYKEIRQCAVPPSRTCCIRGSGYTLLHTREDNERGSAPHTNYSTNATHFPCPTKRLAPKHDETELHTQLIQPAAQTPPQCPHPAMHLKGPGVPPRSALTYARGKEPCLISAAEYRDSPTFSGSDGIGLSR